MRGSIRFGCQLLPCHRMYVHNPLETTSFSFTILFISTATQLYSVHSNWFANVCTLFIVASVIWNHISAVTL